MDGPSSHYNNYNRQTTAGGFDQSDFAHTRGHDYNIFKYPADVSEARAHSVK